MTNNEALKELFINSKLKKNQFAIKHNVMPQNFNKWLTGERNISNNTLTRIAKKEGYKVIFNNKIEKL